MANHGELIMSISKTNGKSQIRQGIHATNDYERSLFGAVKERFRQIGLQGWMYSDRSEPMAYFLIW